MADDAKYIPVLLVSRGHLHDEPGIRLVMKPAPWWIYQICQTGMIGQALSNREPIANICKNENCQSVAACFITGGSFGKWVKTWPWFYLWADDASLTNLVSEWLYNQHLGEFTKPSRMKVLGQLLPERQLVVKISKKVQSKSVATCLISLGSLSGWCRIWPWFYLWAARGSGHLCDEPDIRLIVPPAPLWIHKIFRTEGATVRQ